MNLKKMSKSSQVAMKYYWIFLITKDLLLVKILNIFVSIGRLKTYSGNLETPCMKFWERNMTIHV